MDGSCNRRQINNVIIFSSNNSFSVHLFLIKDNSIMARSDVLRQVGRETTAFINTVQRLIMPREERPFVLYAGWYLAAFLEGVGGYDDLG